MSDRALDSRGLVARAEANKRFGEADFDGWVRGILDGLSFESALDICCGTGNQLVLYAAREGLRRLVGVDLSAESLALARARLDSLGAPHELHEVAMEDAFARPDTAEARFDLVSCVYGLYYAKNPAHTLHQMIDHTAPGGTVLVVGPWGRNNATFFDLLQRHVTLPPLVVSSATTFMEETVVPAIERGGLALETSTFVNPVRYPKPTALLDYWRASTFYEPAHEPAVVRDIEAHFATRDAFVVEKHVMAAVGRKVPA